jgi:PAS domain S-box-containing protein
MPEPSRLRVLVVEDDADTRTNLCDILELDGHDVVAASTAAEALGRDDWDSYAAIVLDWRLPEAAVIVSTGAAGLDGAVVALRHGVVDYITKPVDSDLLRASLRRVAEQQRLKRDKARSEAAFRSLVEAAGSMILILHADGSVIYMNPSGEELTGYDMDEVLERNCLALLVPEAHRAGAQDCMRRVLEGRPERGFELPVAGRNGDLHWLLWNVQRLDEFAGQPAVLAVGQDVTDRRRAEEKLLQSERLAAIGKAMTGLAHESRNALQRSQAILEMLTMLLSGQSEAMDLIGRLHRAHNDLHQLYEEVREYAAPLKLRPEPCHVGQIVRESWDLLAYARDGRRVEFREQGGELDLRCALDRFSIVQAFRNIFENSLSAAGDPVCITVQYSATALDGRPAITIAVRDNGPGIPSEQCQKVFDEFFTTKTRGTGLGLAIVRRFVEAHGGRVAANPDRRDGAELLVTLPRVQER